MATNNALNVQGPTPAFSVNFSTATNKTGDGTVYKLTGPASYDLLSSWQTDHFVAPIHGIYTFGGLMRVTGVAADQTQYLLFASVALHAGGNRQYDLFNWQFSSLPYTVLAQPFCKDIEMQAGDSISFSLAVYGVSKTITITYGTSYMNGRLCFAI